MKTNFNYKGTAVKVQKKRIKNMHMRWKGDHVLITCPLELNDNKIIHFLERRFDHLNKNTHHELYGKDNYNIFGEIIKTHSTDSVFNRKFIKNYAVKNYTKYALDIAKKLGFKDVTIKFRDMKTRWGVCHYTKNKIILNTRLLFRTLEEFNYVIIHEVCHLIHPDHSKQFWSELEKHYPNYIKMEKLLKKHDH